MRRILWTAGCYGAGLATLPVLLWALEFGSQTSRAVLIEGRTSVAKADEPTADRAEVGEAEAVKSVATDRAAGGLEIAQAQPRTPRTPSDAFDLEPRSVSPFEDSVPQPASKPKLVLPVAPEFLHSADNPDEATVAKLKGLRELLQQVVAEKSEKLSVEALEAEIELHRRHLADLNALEELLRLEKNLQELRDKYPDSDSGRKAGDLLKMLEQLRQKKMNASSPFLPG